jgi:hypothetical protein
MFLRDILPESHLSFEKDNYLIDYLGVRWDGTPQRIMNLGNQRAFSAFTDYHNSPLLYQEDLCCQQSLKILKYEKTGFDSGIVGFVCTPIALLCNPLLVSHLENQHIDNFHFFTCDVLW